MGGDLLFDSREGQGTRVSITLPQLPFADKEEPSGERWKRGTEPAGVAPSGHARRVLIVEDDGSSRYGLKSLLESEGYEVVEASDLSQAAERIASQAPEVVVLDITLPDGDGAAWLAGLREKGPVTFPGDRADGSHGRRGPPPHRARRASPPSCTSRSTCTCFSSALSA